MKNKLFAGLLASATILGSIAPLASVSAEGVYKIHLSEQKTDINGEKLKGSEYRVVQVQGAYDPVTGAFKEATPELAAGFTIKLNGEAGQAMPGGVSLEVTPEGIHSITLPEGTYKLTEVKATDGYYTITEEIQVHLPGTDPSGSRLVDEVTITPKRQEILKKIVLSKHSDTEAGGEMVAGAKFKLFRSISQTEGGEDIWAEHPSLEAEGKYTTTQEGTITVENLPYGKYYFIETDAPETHLLLTDKIEFEVKQDEDNKLDLTAKTINFRKPEIDKELLTKDFASELPGSETNPDVRNHNTEVGYVIKVKIPHDIANYKNFVVRDSMDARLSLISDSFAIDGQTFTDLFTLEHVDPMDELAVEEFRLTTTPEQRQALAAFAGQEIKIKYRSKIDDATPAGLALENRVFLDYTNKSDQEGSIDDPTDPLVKTPSNTLKLIKVDGTTNARLNGAKFKLYYGTEINEDNLISEQISSNMLNEDGIILWDNLKNGTYTLVETEVPVGDENGDNAGYRLLNKPIQITLDSTSGETVITEKTVQNYKKSVFIPNTGTFGALGFIAIGGGVFLMSSVKRKEEE